MNKLRYFQRFAIGFAGACVALAAVSAQAQYPSKLIRFIVPFPPGGGMDTVARAVGEKLSPRLGQPIVVENKPGAGTTIGTDAAAKSAPDGYTFLFGPVAGQAMEQHIRAKRVVDIQRDFAAVVSIGHGTVALVVPQASRAKSVAELVALAKANPGKLTFASAGTGVVNHLTGELFMQVTGVEMTHVPYKGTQQFLPDLLDGRVDMAFDSLPAYLPHLKSGRLRVLAVAAPERAMALPEVPTMAEAGAPGVLSQTDYAIFAPAGTPREAIMRINRETNAVLQMDELRARLAALGIKVTGGSPEALQAEFAEEMTKWGRVIREAKIPPQ